MPLRTSEHLHGMGNSHLHLCSYEKYKEWEKMNSNMYLKVKQGKVSSID